MMKSLDKITNKYRKVIKKTSNGRNANDDLLIEFINRIIAFYKLYDIQQKTNHALILELVFKNKRKLSTVTISEKTYISVKTLYRFKKQYSFFMSEILQNGIFGNEFGQILSEFFL